MGHMQQTEKLTTRMAAEKLGVSVRTVHRLVARGILPAERVPGYRGNLLFTEDGIKQARQALAAGTRN